MPEHGVTSDGDGSLGRPTRRFCSRVHKLLQWAAPMGRAGPMASLPRWREGLVSARTTDSARDIPEATVARLPVYLRALVTLADQGTGTCSSEELAAAA